VRLLLDTHVLLWWLRDDPRLGRGPRALIAHVDVDVLVSAASCWEASIKARKGKIDVFGSALWRLATEEGFKTIGIEQSHLVEMEQLPKVAGHGDPFDHLLLAQAKAENAALMTADRFLGSYGVPCVGVR
jgi:PIN domain nuclease of toxin-antitoxin system